MNKTLDTADIPKSLKLLKGLLAFLAVILIVYLTFFGLPIFLMGGGPLWILGLIYIIPLSLIVLIFFMDKKSIWVWLILLILTLIIIAYSALRNLTFSIINMNFYMLLLGVVVLYLLLRPDIRLYYFGGHTPIDNEKVLASSDTYRNIIRWIIYFFTALTIFYIFTGGISSLQYGSKYLWSLIIRIILTIALLVMAIRINNPEKNTWIISISSISFLVITSAYYSWNTFSIILKKPEMLYRSIDIITIIIGIILIILLLTQSIRKYYQINN